MHLKQKRKKPMRVLYIASEREREKGAQAGGGY